MVVCIRYFKIGYSDSLYITYSSGHGLTLFFANFEVGRCSLLWSRMLIIRSSSDYRPIRFGGTGQHTYPVSLSYPFLLTLLLNSPTQGWQVQLHGGLDVSSLQFVNHESNCLSCIFIGFCLFTLLLRWHVSLKMSVFNREVLTNPILVWVA